MDDEKLIEELRTLRREIRLSTYSIWALGIFLNLSHQPRPESGEAVSINLDHPEAQKATLRALHGFLILVKRAMDETEKGDPNLPLPPSWTM
jgi:hypothetical protein